MPSDAKVPDAVSRGLTVPAAVVVVLVVLAAAWGTGMFLVGRQSVPQPATVDHAAGHLGWLNRLDHSIAQGDLSGAVAQMRTPLLPDGPLGETALALRRLRLEALAAERAAASEAASPTAVLRRLRAHLWSLDPHVVDRLTPPAPTVATVDSATPRPALVSAPPSPTPSPTTLPPTALPTAPPPTPPLAEEKLDGQSFIPVARLVHPAVANRAYAIHPVRGLLRSDDGGTHWRSGLEPLTQLTGNRLVFSQGERPLLIIVAERLWLFADDADEFFPAPDADHPDADD